MQKILNITLIAAILVLGYFQFCKPKGKLVYVENVKIMSNYDGMKAAVEQYQIKSAGWKAHVDTLQKEFEQAMKDYEKARAGMSKKERALAEEKLHVKQNQLVHYKETMQKKAKEEDAKLTAAVMKVANKYIKEFGEEREYKIIIGATQGGNVIYADEAINVTDEALEWMNKRYAGK